MNALTDIQSLPLHPDPVVLPPDFNRVHEIFEELAGRYGPLFTVRFADRPMLVVSDAPSVNWVLRHRLDLFGPYRRKTRVLETLRVDGLEAADGWDWKRQREMLTAAMDSRYLALYFEPLRKAVADLRERWNTHGEALSQDEIESDIMGFSIAAYTAILFGGPAGLPGDDPAVGELLHGLIALLGPRIDALLPGMHLDRLPEQAGFTGEIGRIFEILEAVVAHNREALGQRRGAAASLLQALLETAEQKGWDIRGVKLLENILLIVLAAEPTTANTLFRVLGFLAENPNVQEALRHELDGIPLSGDALSEMESVKKLKCLDAVILETMRLSSVSRFAIVEAKEDLFLNGIRVPEGTPLILLLAYCAHAEENFSQADRFDYRRWQSECRSETQAHNTKAFLAFGGGPRACPGRNLAMLVLKTALAMICRNFTIRPAQPEDAPQIPPRKPAEMPSEFTLAARNEPCGPQAACR